MKLMYAIFFGAAAGGFAYTKIGRRVGYGNQTNVWTIVGVAFVLTTIVFYTILALFIPNN